MGSIYKTKILPDFSMSLSKSGCLFSLHFIIFMLLNPVCSYSQTHNFRFEHIGSRDGLSQVNVNCIIQDSRGFMWVGTRNGLNRYDGYKFLTFRNDQKNRFSISNNMITDIVEDKNGDIWVATQYGLNKYIRKTGKFTRYTHSLTGNSMATNVINRLALNADGNLWVALQNNGLDFMDIHTGMFIHHSHSDRDSSSIADNNVKTVFMDNQHRIWVGTAKGGLSRYDVKSNKFISYKYPGTGTRGAIGSNVVCIVQNAPHQLWIGTQEDGLYLFDTEKHSFKRFIHNEKLPNTLSSNTIYSLRKDDDGGLWIGTENGGLCYLDQKTGKFYTYMHDEVDVNSFLGNSIYGICKDRAGNMWLGAFGGGINLFKKTTTNFTLYRHNSQPTSLSNNFVLALFEDEKKNIWIGTDGGGVNKFDPETESFTSYKRTDGKANEIAGNYVLNVSQDKNGDLWFGTWGDGISILDHLTKKFSYLNKDLGGKQKLAGNNVYNITHTSDNKTWISEFGEGLDCYDNNTKTIRHYRLNINDPKSLGSNNVYALHEDAKANLWLGTADAGLDLFDKKTNTFSHFQHSDKSNSLSNNSVTDIYEDKKGNLWLSTLSGLDIFDPITHKFKIFTKNDGLPSDIIYSVKQDNEGKFWISTNNGLSRYDPETNRFTNYNTEDGIQGDEFKPHSSLKTRSGKLYFGGINGLNSFFPDQIQRHETFAPLVITSFELFNKPVFIADSINDPSPLKQDISDTHTITLSYKQSVFSMEFAALDFMPAEKNQYAYTLTGFDKDWNYVGSRNTAAYTNLPPGDYTFRLKYLNNAGVWSPVNNILKITILPPFWLTWWFELISFVLIIAAVYGIFKYRLRSIRLKHLMLERQVTERTSLLEQMTIEEKKSREQAERALKTAENANQAKSIFLATMSHEIRTPMNGMMGMATLLHDTNLSTEQKEYANTILHSGEALLNVINDILDFSKIESGNMELDLHNFDLRHSLEEVTDLFSGKLAATGLDMVYYIEPDVPHYLIGDSLRLRQVLINLVGNAVKFTQKGEIYIGVSINEVPDADAIGLSFEVRDTGIGIDGDKLPKLFRAFSQVDSSNTRKYGGTGLGLAISGKLIKLMGGEISVSSIAGAGTTFTFTIICKTGIEHPKLAEPDIAYLKGKKVLVVDDNATNRRVLELQLHQWKMIPVLAKGGSEAVELLAAIKDFDVVITDQQMPEIDGLELCKLIKLTSNNLPAILLTSIGDEIKSKHPGLFSAVLSKPFKQSQLFKELCRLFQKPGAITVTEAKPAGLFDQGFASQNPLNILVAEDNAINQKMILRVLEKLGYSASLAVNGYEVIEKLEHEYYDLILMDVQMPEMDGLEATRIIRENHKKQPFIIAMTANAMIEDRDECLRAGMDNYIAKPVKVELLMTMLKDLSPLNKMVY